MKRSVNFRFSEETIRLLGELAKGLGINRTSVVEMLIHREYRELGKSKVKKRDAK